MSTHRKIEWSLFIIGLVGTLLSFSLNATIIQLALFGLGTIFAGLHAFKLFDGHKANHVVVASALALVVYTMVLGVINLSEVMDRADIISGFVVSVLLATLSLRLRQDFHPK